MPWGDVAAPPIYTRGTGGGAVPTAAGTSRNSGAPRIEPLPAAIRDWAKDHQRELFETLSIAIRESVSGRLHVALDALAAIEGLLHDDPSTALDGYEKFDNQGWDGEDAAPIEAKDVAFARRLLAELGTSIPKPDAAPGIDGSICMEWIVEARSGTQKVFVDVGPSGRVLTYAKFGDLPPIEKHFEAQDEPAIRAHLRWLFLEYTVRSGGSKVGTG